MLYNRKTFTIKGRQRYWEVRSRAGHRVTERCNRKTETEQLNTQCKCRGGVWKEVDFTELLHVGRRVTIFSANTLILLLYILAIFMLYNVHLFYFHPVVHSCMFTCALLHHFLWHFHPVRTATTWPLCARIGYLWICSTSAWDGSIYMYSKQRDWLKNIYPFFFFSWDRDNYVFYRLISLKKLATLKLFHVLSYVWVQ